MDSRFHDTDTAAQGTCKWLLRHNIYIRWAYCDRGLLWIKGKPGSGKSTLLRYALNNVTEILNIRESALVLSFFFHGRGSELQKTPLGLFRSLLHQLLRQVPKALTDLVATFQQRCETIGKPGKQWQWHPRELQRFLESSLRKVLEARTVWLFVDALDECGKENAVNLTEEFKSMPPKLKTDKFDIARWPKVVVRFLLLTGKANVNTKDRNGWTPLSRAAENGHEAVVRLLLERGARIEAADKWDRTPLSKAAENGHEAVVRLLQFHGAQPSSTTSP